MKQVTSIIATLFLLCSTTVAQQQALLNKTWKIKAVNTVYQTTNISLFHKDSTSNQTDYSALQFNFQAQNVYTVNTGTGNNQGSWQFNNTGDSVTIDNVPYKLIKADADSFITRGFSLHVTDEAGTMDTAYTFMTMYSLASLPVSILSFTGIYRNELIHLDWSTAQEQNNKEFEIQYSTDGVNFNKIGKVDGKGNTNSISRYSHTTGQFTTGRNYYRLKQIDFDGRSDYSRIVTITVNGTGRPLISFAPNPASNKVTLSITQPFTTRVQLTLTSAIGKRVWTGNINPGTTTTTIYLNGIQKGMYVLSATDQKGDNIFYDKLIIQ
jgi:hypothetical protein